MMVVTAVALVYSSNIVHIVNALGEKTLVSQVHQLEMEFAMITTILQLVTMMVETAVSLFFNSVHHFIYKITLLVIMAIQFC